MISSDMDSATLEYPSAVPWGIECLPFGIQLFSGLVSEYGVTENSEGMGSYCWSVPRSATLLAD